MATFTQPELNMLIADLTFAGRSIRAKSRDATEEVIEKVADTGKQLAPRDSGGGADSITSEVRDEFGRTLGIAGPEAYYMRFVEDGTSKQSPQAFMGPALDRHAPELEDKLGEAGEF